MEIIADLHLHSKYSRAVSQRMNISQMWEWGKKKGIDLLATADWTHPLWLKELKANLKEVNEGVFAPLVARDAFFTQSRSDLKIPTSVPLFLLATEISSIYSQGGKLRRIHNLVFAPSFETVDKINAELLARDCNLMADGRPIIGLSSRDLAELVLTIDKNCLIIPAHCLLPETMIHTSKGIQKIKNIKTTDKVFTHKGRVKRVKRVFTRSFKGKVYHIIPDYFRLGIKVTPEHPFWAIKTEKGCRSIGKTLGVCRPVCSQKESCARRYFEKYRPEWIQARDLDKGDVLLFPRFSKIKDVKFIKISDFVENSVIKGTGSKNFKKSRFHKIPNKIKIDKNFCRLAGYYLAEGCTSRDLVSFCFNQKETDYLDEIKTAFREIFGIKKYGEYKRRNYRSRELTFYSQILHKLFSKLFYKNHRTRKAGGKCLPNWMLWLPKNKQKEILIGWWRGDKGYTTSRLLMNQMKILCLRLGIIPSIRKDSKKDYENRGKHKLDGREIRANNDLYSFSNLSFFGDPFNLLSETVFKKFRTKMRRRRGWLDKDYVYLPISRIVKEEYKGKVYNLEIEEDNSYVAEFACVHNCWTPWFALFGSKSGFDSLEECFGDMSRYIYAGETGLSSDPAMNWRVKDLDKRSIVSFSDAHSPEKLGREATVFKIQNSKFKIQKFNYFDLVEAIKGVGDWQIAYTIEFHPQEGKYHYSGHRNCGVVQSPEETKKLGATCPVCGKPLTLGVMQRVEDLAGREAEMKKVRDENGVLWIYDKNRPPYVMLVPLMEILSEALNIGVSSQVIHNEYKKLIENFGSEFEVLLRTKTEEIERLSGSKIAEGIKKMRMGDLVIDPGYDGVFGKVKIWSASETEKDRPGKQMSFF